MGFQTQQDLSYFEESWNFQPLSNVVTRSSKRLYEDDTDSSYGDDNAVVLRSSKRRNASANYTIHGDDPTSVAVKQAIANKRLQWLSTSKLPITKNSNTNITSIPTEIVIKIFDYLKPVSATVFSLTCTKFFRIKADLNYPPLRITKSENGRFLFNLLTEWMGPDLIYTYAVKKFITMKHWTKMQEERRLALEHRAEKRAKKKMLIARKSARVEAQRAEILRGEQELEQFEETMREIRLRRRLRYAEMLSEVRPSRVTVESQDIWEIEFEG